MSEVITYAQLLMRFVRVEVRINDIPIMLEETDAVTSAMRPIREFLVPGRNTGAFIIEPDDFRRAGDSDDSAIRPDCAVRLRIAEVEDGAFLDFNAGVETFDIAAMPELDAVPPVTASGTFEAQAKHEWAWTSAPPIDPVADRAAIEAFVTKAAKMWAARDVDGLQDLLHLRFTEDSIAYPANPYKNRMIDLKNELNQDDAASWNPVPFDPDRAVYRSIANGRLIQAVDPDGLSLIRTPYEDPNDPTAPPSNFSLTMMLGYHEGTLKILL